nr:hypothetical protein SHINE37_44347 [Rhizobiaceae bacterium]
MPQPAAIAVGRPCDIQSIAGDGFLIFVRMAEKNLPNQSLNWIDLQVGMVIRQSRKFSEKTFNISSYCA